MDWIKRLAAAGIAIALLVLAIFMGEQAFQQVLDFRMLERIPLTSVIASSEGEVQLHGRASPVEKALLSPKTQTPCVYYHYTIEEEYRDSDGDTRWRNIHDSRDAVNIVLDDHSGQVTLLAATAINQIDWSSAQKYYKQQGDRRYTEWRVDVDDQITVFGWLTNGLKAPSVSFNHQGDYLPIISSFGADDARGDIGWMAVLYLTLAITAISFMVYAIIFALAIHKVLVFLSLMTFACSSLLIHYGWKSLENDVINGYQRVATQQQRATAVINTLFNDHGLGAVPAALNFDLNAPSYNSLSIHNRDKINGLRMAAFEVRERYLIQIQRFPENIYASVKSLHKPSDIQLPADQQALATQRVKAYKPTKIAQQTLLTLGGLLITIVAAWIAFRLIRVKRIQENLPTTKTAGVVFGLTEIKGQLKASDSSDLLSGPVSGEACCWYHYIVKEKRGSGKIASGSPSKTVSKNKLSTVRMTKAGCVYSLPKPRLLVNTAAPIDKVIDTISKRV